MRPLKKHLSPQAIAHNYRVLQQHAAPAKLVAVVKANAYGHGANQVVKALPNDAVLAVACIEEALSLRAFGFAHEIWLLEGIFEPDESALCAEHGFVPCVHSLHQLEWLAQSALAQRVMIKLDSGMHRLGFALDDLSWQSALAHHPQIQCLGVASHFACADEADLTHARAQSQALLSFCAQNASGLARSFANSAALLNLPEARGEWVRAGIALYGIAPCEPSTLPLRPALTLETEIIAVRHLKQGDSAGYGGAFVAPTEGYLATIALGYGDGFPRAIESGKVMVYLRGAKRFVPLVGRVSMDMSLVWLGSQSAWVGEQVEIFGANNPIERVALQAGTIPYTLCTMLTGRVAVRE